MGTFTLDNNDYNFNELSARYDKFLIPAFKILVDGVDLVSQGAGIVSITVESSVEKADSFSFTISKCFDVTNRSWQWQDQCQVGKPIKIEMGYSDKMRPVFDGLITSVRYELSMEKSPSIVVSGMDRTFLLMKGVKSRSFMDKKHSDVISIIASENGLSADVDATSTVYKIIEQSRVTDYQFALWMARESNRTLFVAGKKLYFKKLSKSSPVITLDWALNFFSLSLEVDIADQIGGVEVRGWDMATKKEITGSSRSVNNLGDGSLTGQSVIKTLCGSACKEIEYDAAVVSAEAAATKAQSILDSRSMKLVSGSGEMIGIPEMQAGRFIELENMGSKISSIFYLTSVCHHIDSESGYRTSFTLGGNSF